MFQPGECSEIDCLIIGGGPAGLTAAIYLARFHLSVTVIDAGNSRAGLIPLTRNHAGFPDGIAGAELLARMKRQGALYGAAVRMGAVTSLAQAGGVFLARSDDGSELRARTVLMATGVVNRRPPMADHLHDLALASGLLRYCPICDGYEVTDQRVAVLGSGARGCAEAIFLGSYTSDVTLIAPTGEHVLTAEQRGEMAEAGIALASGYNEITLRDDQIVLDIEDGPAGFDALYAALGSDVRSELAGQLGAERSTEGCLKVDAHQRTSVEGLYAAGDVVLGLDQISHAMGEGGVAATTIRNDLAARNPLRRKDRQSSEPLRHPAASKAMVVTASAGVQPETEPGVASADDGLVILEGPGSVAVTMTADAATRTGISLVAAATTVTL